jgi:hypothetical protein
MELMASQLNSSYKISTKHVPRDNYTFYNHKLVTGSIERNPDTLQLHRKPGIPKIRMKFKRP